MKESYDCDCGICQICNGERRPGESLESARRRRINHNTTKSTGYLDGPPAKEQGVGRNNDLTTKVKTPAVPTPQGEICPQCNGRGLHHHPDVFVAETICTKCKGLGKLLLT